MRRLRYSNQSETSTIIRAAAGDFGSLNRPVLGSSSELQSHFFVFPASPFKTKALFACAVHEGASHIWRQGSVTFNIYTLVIYLTSKNRALAAHLTILQLYVSWLPYPLKSR